MCCYSCNGSQGPFFNKTLLGCTWHCLRTVTTLPWHAQSPDLPPVAHIWDHLERRVGHPTSLNELEARLQQIWNEMYQDIIQNLNASMPDRIASCICARSGSTGNMPAKFQAHRSNNFADPMMSEWESPYP
ncbi:transposable element Tcb1 transposase [Trichonephila clavipes]|nr:transposable element Tcb1 transposase [Trichonephila clavipes]